MSPASYLTAPPRDAALIVAPSGCKDRRYDARNGASHLDFAAVSGRRDGRLDRLRGHARATCLARLQALLADDPGGDRRGARDSRGSRAARRCVRRRHGEVDCGARAPGAVAGRARRHSGRRGRGSLLAGRASGRGAAQMMRVAAIDLGTNATRLLVADVEDGEVTEVQRRTTITKLGEGVDARRRLLPVPVARVRNTLTDYRRELESLGAERTLAVDGTTAELAGLAGRRTVTLDTIDETLEWLAVTTEEERRERLILPDRSEVLAAGVLILRETLRHLGLGAIDASDRDLLNGAALAAAELPEPVEGEAPPGAYTCC